MRKSQNSTADAKTADCLELTRRLCRGATDIAKRLEEQKACALKVSDIFTPSSEILRSKLKDYCERIIFNDPLGQARKIEELLWRRAFYDAVSTGKKLRKGNTWNDIEKTLLLTHLTVGIGFYHHLILRLQLECNLDWAGIIDFAYPKHKIILSDKDKNTSLKFQSEEARQCAIRIIHRSLVCLGDLERYKSDLKTNWDPIIAMRYYKMAIAIDDNIGMPYNQLGTLAGNKNHGIDAVYYYMKCILCSESFEGAECNLKRIISSHLFNGNEKIFSYRCIARLYTLLQKWNNNFPNLNQINQDCQNLLIDIENSLDNDKIQLTGQLDENNKNETIPLLTHDILFKMIAICLMTISKLQNINTSQVQGIIAFILSLISILIQVTVNNLQKSFINLTIIHEKSLENNSEMIKADETSTALIDDGKMKINSKSTTTKSILTHSTSDSKIENGHMSNGNVKKLKDKSKKSLLSKLRRRKRMNSSDSEGSDADIHGDSSSEDLNSDVSETEEDEEEEEEEDDEEEEEEEARTVDNNQAECASKHLDEVKDSEDKQKILTNGVLNVSTNGFNGINKSKDNEINSECSSKTDDLELNGIESDEKLKFNKNILTPIELIDIISNENLLHSIKICFDWLKGNVNIIKMICKSSKILLERMVNLFNLIKIDFELIIKKLDRETTFLLNSNKLNEYIINIPLPEDIELKNLDLLKYSQNNLDWDILRNIKMTKYEQVILRVFKLIEFGKYLTTINDTGMIINESGDFELRLTDHKSGINIMNKKETILEHPRGKLMQNMGKLWLKAEVRALESRLRSKLMSPYLVADHDALTKHTAALKRLAYSKKFIIVIPSVVVSALDEMKRTSGRAREATRWLENQLKKGSRFLRAQRPQERLPIPFIKAPKAKDREAWLFFQIIECCHYLTQQNKVGINNDTEQPVVTLLTGISIEERKLSTFSLDGLAKSAGINLEHIESFYSKWKTSSKSHG